MWFSFMNLLSGYLILGPISARGPRSAAKAARKNIFQWYNDTYKDIILWNIAIANLIQVDPVPSETTEVIVGLKKFPPPPYYQK